MINLHREMLLRKLKSKMLLQVHDELVFEVPENEMAECGSLSGDDGQRHQTHYLAESRNQNGKNWGEMEK